MNARRLAITPNLPDGDEINAKSKKPPESSPSVSRGDLAVDHDSLLEILSSGEKVGKLPGSLRTDTLRLLGHPKSTISAIRSKCIDCSAGRLAEIRNCAFTDCPLWPMRMGTNPFHGKRGDKSLKGKADVNPDMGGHDGW